MCALLDFLIGFLFLIVASLMERLKRWKVSDLNSLLLIGQQRKWDAISPCRTIFGTLTGDSSAHRRSTCEEMDLFIEQSRQVSGLSLQKVFLKRR